VKKRSARTKVTAGKVGEAVRTRLKREQVTSAVLSSDSMEWYTPAPFVEAAREVLGAIDLDPASCELANRTVRADRYFAASDDGLAHAWSGRVFLNPPYGAQAPRFVARLVDQHARGVTTAAIALLNAHGTDTSWFQPLFDHTLCFTRGRVEFYSPTERASAPTFGAVFAYLGPDDERFARVFSRFGAVLVRHRDSGSDVLPLATPGEEALLARNLNLFDGEAAS
jgi:DNA N-6-adenine-methyltransferase (Dam)